MKRFFTFAMLFAVAAMAFTSCTKDGAIDSPEYSGKTKTITVKSTITDTRTLLTEDHKIKWEKGDKYRIIFADENYNILGNTLSPAYDPDETQYTLEVPENTKYFCCCYPDLYPIAYYMPKDLSNATVDLWRNSEFKDVNVMLCKAEISDENTVYVKFKPVVTILEVNVYDTSGKSTDDYNYSVTVSASEPFAEEAYYDFTSDSATLTDFAADNFVIHNTTDKVADSKETGTKFYFAVGKGVYSKLEFEVKTNVKGEFEDYNTFNYIYKDIDISQYSGYTVNIDLAKESDQPEFPTEPLVTDLKVETLGPWLVSAKFNVSSDCVKYVIGGMPTEERDMGDDLFSNDGYDEEKFIEDAKDALSAGDNYSKWLAFNVADSSQEQTVTELYMRGGTQDEPNGLRLNSTRGEYTIAVYAVDGSGNGQVYTTTFTAPAFSMGNGLVTPSVASTKNQKDSATATISADGAEYIFYGYSNTLSAAPTEAQINAMYTSSEMDTYFVKYESPVTLDFQKWGTSNYIVWAVAVDAAGAISSVASQTFEYQEDVVDTDGSATIDSFEALHLWQVNDDDDSPIYELEAKFSLSDDAAKVAIFYLAESATNNSDNPIKLTADMVKNSLISEMNSKNGLAYTKAEAEKGIRLPISTTYADSENKTGAKPETSYYMFAVATDANGAYGNFENLAWVGGYTIDQPTFLLVPYTIELKVEKEEKGGGDVETTNYWKQNLTGKYTDWLKFANYTPWFGSWDVDVTWETNANGYENVKGVYITYFTLSEFSTDAVIAKVKANFAGYNPADPHKSVTGQYLNQSYGAVKQLAPNPPQLWEGESCYVFPGTTMEGMVYVSVLVDNDGYLTMKTAAYLEGNESSAEAHYVDLTELAK